MYSKTTFKLNTGAEIPAVGFGTWQDEDAQEDAVYEALQAGYRHIDTAHVYGTEASVAQGIARAGVSREDLFLVTKLWNNSHRSDVVEAACDASLKDLRVDYVDLYLMHWPCAFKTGADFMPKRDDKMELEDIDYVDTWKAMEALLQTGKVKAIGVSNLSKAELERVCKEGSVTPAVHQLESHPYLAQHEFSDFHDSKGIHVTQYSPLGNSNPMYHQHESVGRLIEDSTLLEIGAKYNKNAAQVALAWAITRGHSVVPKSKTMSRIQGNLEGDFRLGAEDMKRIDELDKKLRFMDPSALFGYEFYRNLDGKQ